MQTWRYVLKGDGDVRFQTLVLADNPAVTGQKLRAIGRATIGGSSDKLLKIELSAPRDSRGVIQAGQSARFDVLIENLSAKKTLRIGPTFFLRRYGSVLPVGPEEFTQDIDRPGLWSKDRLEPKEKVTIRLHLRSADDLSNTLETFRLDLRTSAQVEETADGKTSWRDVERKEMVVSPSDGRIVGSIQHSQRAAQEGYDPLNEAITAVGGILAEQMTSVLFFAYDLEQNPQKLADGAAFVYGGALKLGSRLAFYSHRLEAMSVSASWYVMPPNERAKLLFEAWQGLRQDVPAASAFAKMTFEEIAKPITVAMDKAAEGTRPGTTTCCSADGSTASRTPTSSASPSRATRSRRATSSRTKRSRSSATPSCASWSPGRRAAASPRIWRLRHRRHAAWDEEPARRGALPGCQGRVPVRHLALRQAGTRHRRGQRAPVAGAHGPRP